MTTTTSAVQAVPLLAAACIEDRSDPLRLVNARGRTLAEPSDVVRFAGGSGTGNESLPPGSCHVEDEVAVLNEFLGKGLPEGVE